MTRLIRLFAAGFSLAALLVSGPAAAATYSVSGVVKNQNGMTLPGVRLTWQNELVPSEPEKTVTTNTSGQYSVSGLVGTYRVELFNPASGNTATITGIKVEQNTARDFTLIEEIATVTLSGTVYRPDDGLPARNAYVDIFRVVNNSVQHWTGAYTDVNGRYSFTGEAGEWIVQMHTHSVPSLEQKHRGYVLVTNRLPMSADRTLDVRPRLMEVKGTLTTGDDCDQPVRGMQVQVWVRAHANGYTSSQNIGVAIVDDDGSYTLELLQPGLDDSLRLYTNWEAMPAPGASCVGTEARSFHGYDYSTFSPGTDVVPPTTIDQCLPGQPTFHVRVLDIENKPIRTEVQVQNSSVGRTYTVQTDGETGSACFAVAEGRLSQVRFYNGSYYSADQSRHPTVAQGQWFIYDLEMPSTGLDLGTVYWPTKLITGQLSPRIANAGMNPRRRSYSGYAQVRTDAAGNYLIPVMPSNQRAFRRGPDGQFVADEPTYQDRWRVEMSLGNRTGCGEDGLSACPYYFHHIFDLSDTTAYQSSPFSVVAVREELALDLTIPEAAQMRGYIYDAHNETIRGAYWYGYQYWKDPLYPHDGGWSLHQGYHYTTNPDDSYTAYLNPGVLGYTYLYTPCGTNFNPRTDAPYAPLCFSVNYERDTAVLPGFSVRNFYVGTKTVPINIEVVNARGLGLRGTRVNLFSNQTPPSVNYPMGYVLDFSGRVDSFPHTAPELPVDPPLVYPTSGWVYVTPPESTGLPSVSVNEQLNTPKTLTYVYNTASNEPAKILSSVTSGVTDTSFTREVATDQETTATLCCGLDPAELNACTGPSPSGTSHSLALDGLDPSTDYSCQVCVTNGRGRTTCGDTFVERTADGCDEVAPLQSEFAYNISDTRAVVTWTTNEPAVGSVSGYAIELGEGAGDIGTRYETASGTNHQITLENLQKATAYQLFVSSVDACGNTATVSNVVTTLETREEANTTPPVCTGTLVEVGTNHVVYRVSCDGPAFINVLCSSAENEPVEGVSTPLRQETSLTITGLRSDMAYTCGLIAQDGLLNEADAVELPPFTTRTFVPPLAIVAGPTVEATDRTAQISWVTGSDTADGQPLRATSAEVRWVAAVDGDCPDVSTWNAGNKVSRASPASDHQLTVNGLAASTTYCYFVSSVDQQGVPVRSDVATFTTEAFVPPLEVTQVAAATDLSSCATLTFDVTLNRPALVYVQYSLNADLKDSSRLLSITTASTTHRLRLNDALEGVTYHYRVVAYLADGEAVMSPQTAPWLAITNCGQLPDAAPVIEGTGGPYTAQCTSTAGGAVVLSSVVKDPYDCGLDVCPGDAILDCEWFDDATDQPVASASTQGGVAGPPVDAQSCSAEDVVLPLGPTTLYLKVSDGKNTTRSAPFGVNVVDPDPPVVDAGPDVVWPARASNCTSLTGRPGILVNTFDVDGDGIDDTARPASATDTCDANLILSSTPTTFNRANGTICVDYATLTAVTISARDDFENAGSDSFTVWAADPCEGVSCEAMDGQCTWGECEPSTDEGRCVQRNVPEHTFCEDGDPCTVADSCSANGVCSGTPKDCSAFDGACTVGQCHGETGGCEAVPLPQGTACLVGGQDGTCTVDGQCVTDVVPPTVFVPEDDVHFVTADSSGVLVEFMVTAEDDREGEVPVSCEPASGSLFAVGTTPVTCTAQDAAGNVASASFFVLVSLDSDGDGVFDEDDDCPDVFNPDQADLDGDGWGDVCDRAPATYDPTNTTESDDEAATTDPDGDTTIVVGDEEVVVHLPPGSTSEPTTVTVVHSDDEDRPGTAIHEEEETTVQVVAEGGVFVGGETNYEFPPDALPVISVTVDANDTIDAAVAANALVLATFEDTDGDGEADGWVTIPACTSGSTTADGRCTTVVPVDRDGDGVVDGYTLSAPVTHSGPFAVLILNLPPVAKTRAVIEKIADASCGVSVTVEEVDDGSWDPNVYDAEHNTAAIEPTHGATVSLALSQTTFQGLGDHPVTLTATDQDGRTDTAQAIVRVIAPISVDVNPKTINVKSNGKDVTVYLEFDQAACGRGPVDVDLASVTLQAVSPVTSEALPVAAGRPSEVGDGNGDGVPDRMVKFDRATVQSWFAADGDVVFRVAGRFVDGTSFVGDDSSVRVSHAEETPGSGNGKGNANGKGKGQEQTREQQSGNNGKGKGTSNGRG